MTKIKICGITKIEDAILAIDLGADALGFIFYEQSRRCITPSEAGYIISQLPPFICTVGVFVNQSWEEINNIREKAGFDTVQLHGDESAELCERLGGRTIKTIRVRDSINSNEIERYPTHAILFDTYSTKGYGGTGESFSWEILKNLETSKRLILSGGLSPENVSAAIQIVKPYAVDISSGVEESYRKKSPEKLRRFIEAVRNGN